jgi:hypothetical protein
VSPPLWEFRTFTPSLFQYYTILAAPITSVLGDMTILGIMADVAFIQAEIARLDVIMDAASAAHLAAFGQALVPGDKMLIKWIYGSLRNANEMMNLVEFGHVV